jgi:ssDNA-binding Zn-finger/Zn-ribbon topoisomerase 1
MFDPDWPPLCEKCLVPMWVRESPKMPTTYGCDEPNCTRRYNAHKGYFDVDGRVEEQRRCPNDKSPLFLNSISPDAIETWRCPLPHCTYEWKQLKHLPYAHE